MVNDQNILPSIKYSKKFFFFFIFHKIPAIILGLDSHTFSYLKNSVYLSIYHFPESVKK